MKSAREVYENLGTIIVLSLLWAVPVALVVGGLLGGSVVGQVAFTVGWVSLGPVTLAVWAVGNRIARGSPGRIRDFVDGLRGRMVPGLLLFLALVLISTLLVANVRFYFSSTLGVLGRPLDWAGAGIRVGQLVGLFWLAPLTLWVLMQLYVLALVVEQDVSVGRALRRAAILVLDNVIFTLGMTLVVVVLATVCILSGVGMFAFFAGAMAVLTNNALRQLLARYALPSEQPDGHT